MNQVILMGRLTRDPELRYTQSGIPVASFTLAVDRGYASRENGERQTDFIDCVAWRNTGEFISKYFVKGQMCAVTGKLQIRDWTDKDGNKRRSAEVVIDNAYFTESKRNRENGNDYSTRYSVPGNAPAQNPDDNSFPDYSGASEFAELDDDDGELPF